MLFSAWVLTAAGGCQSARELAEQEAAQRAATLYSDEAVRSADKGARAEDLLLVVKLKNLREERAALITNIARGKRLLADAGKQHDPGAEYERDSLAKYEKQLTETDPKWSTARRRVEDRKTELVALKGSTETVLAEARADAGPSPGVLRDRLAGIEKVLVAVAAELEADAGAPTP